MYITSVNIFMWQEVEKLMQFAWNKLSVLSRVRRLQGSGSISL